MARLISNMLRSLADCCDDGANPEIRINELIEEHKKDKDALLHMKRDLYDMQCLIGFLGTKIKSLETTKEDSSCVCIPFNKEEK